jgi:hypothetical protein
MERIGDKLINKIVPHRTEKWRILWAGLNRGSKYFGVAQTPWIKFEVAQTFFVVAFFGSTPLSPTLREQLFELKNEDAINKSENLRDTCP